MKIINRFNNAVIYEGTEENMLATVKAALAVDANLCDADLRDADLRGANLRDADLRDADLRDADLRGANLCGADLCDADLRDANLRETSLFIVQSGRRTAYITATRMRIGCQDHDHEFWKAVTPEKAVNIDGCIEDGPAWEMMKPVLVALMDQSAAIGYPKVKKAK